MSGKTRKARRSTVATAMVTMLAIAAAWLSGPARAAADAQAGERAFRRLCSACHATAPGVTRLGPSLHGVVGRKSGAVPGFSYTAAYAAGRVVWTPEVLEEYLKSPKTYMPGSRMNFPGIRNDAERAAVVDYLETLN